MKLKKMLIGVGLICIIGIFGCSIINQQQVCRIYLVSGEIYTIDTSEVIIMEGYIRFTLNGVKTLIPYSQILKIEQIEKDKINA